MPQTHMTPDAPTPSLITPPHHHIDRQTVRFFFWQEPSAEDAEAEAEDSLAREARDARTIGGRISSLYAVCAMVACAIGVYALLVQ